MTIDREEMIAHFSAYGDVTGISMNPTRGYAFIDYRTNECVQIALRYVPHFWRVLPRARSSSSQENSKCFCGRDRRVQHSVGYACRQGGLVLSRVEMLARCKVSRSRG